MVRLFVGGLTAVMYTDTFQTAVMMIGAVIVTAYGNTVKPLYSDMHWERNFVS